MVQDSTTSYSIERQDVWYEMSDLFLDTEFDERARSHMANRLAMSPFSIIELQTIMEDEVAPILHVNLLCVAGQWGMFDRETEVVQPIKLRLSALGGNPAQGWLPFLALKRRFFMFNVGSEWKQILQQVSKLRETKSDST